MSQEPQKQARTRTPVKKQQQENSNPNKEEVKLVKFTDKPKRVSKMKKKASPEQVENEF